MTNRRFIFRCVTDILFDDLIVSSVHRMSILECYINKDYIKKVHRIVDTILCYFFKPVKHSKKCRGNISETLEGKFPHEQNA